MARRPNKDRCSRPPKGYQRLSTLALVERLQHLAPQDRVHLRLIAGASGFVVLPKDSAPSSECVGLQSLQYDPEMPLPSSRVPSETPESITHRFPLAIYDFALSEQ
jgi:hypothetical protein